MVAAVVGYVAYDPSIAGARRQDHWKEVADGRHHLQQGRPDLALRSVERVRDEAPGSGEAMTVAGQALFQLRDYRSARLAFERALKLQPDQADATKTLAALYLMLGDGVRGVELLRAATRLDPNDAKVWLTLGKVSHDLGETAEASAAFDEALKREPGNREALIGVITDLLNSNRSEAATPRLTEALRRSPDDPALLGLAARQARDLGRPDEALALATRALKGDPDDFNALLVRARIEAASGHPDRALGDLERAVAARPNDTGALQLLVQVQSRLGMSEKASETIARHRRAVERGTLMDKITREIALRPDDPEPRYRMGRLAAEGGSDLLAGRCFEAALALDPGYQPARDGLLALRIAQRMAQPKPGQAGPEGGKSGTPGLPVPASH
jgi:tetratricopeptide (TPR) repeat protein